MSLTYNPDCWAVRSATFQYWVIFFKQVSSGGQLYVKSDKMPLNIWIDIPNLLVYDSPFRFQVGTVQDSDVQQKNNVSQQIDLHSESVILVTSHQD